MPNNEFSNLIYLIAKGTGYSRKQSICHQLCRFGGFNTHVKCHDRGNAFQRPHLPWWMDVQRFGKSLPLKIYKGTFKRNLDRLNQAFEVWRSVFNFGRGRGGGNKCWRTGNTGDQCGDVIMEIWMWISMDWMDWVASTENCRRETHWRWSKSMQIYRKRNWNKQKETQNT